MSTSERLVGSVAVGVVIVDGPASALKSTAAERAALLAEVQTGLAWLAAQNPGATISWWYDLHHVVLAQDFGASPLANEDWTHGPFYGDRGTFFADVTGDGRPDAIVVNNGTVTVRPNLGSEFGPGEDWTHGPFYGERATVFADLTGDGRADAIALNDATVTVRRNMGNDFGPDASANEDWTHGPFYGSRGTYFADLTGDGRADAIAINDDTVTVRRTI